MGEGSAADLYTFYRLALRKAWEDGMISADERNMLSELSPGVDSEDLDKLESREYFRHRWKEYAYSPPEYRLSIIDAAIGFDPENEHLWSERSSILYILDRLDEALEAADRSLSIYSGSSDAWFWKGSVLMKRGRLDDAAECFEDALEVDPDHTMGWLMLGWTERAKGCFDKAKACYDRVLDLCPAFPLGYIERGLTFIRSGDLESAQRDLLCALDLDPQSARAAELLRSMGADLPEEDSATVGEEEAPVGAGTTSVEDGTVTERTGATGDRAQSQERVTQRPRAVIAEEEVPEAEEDDGEVLTEDPFRPEVEADGASYEGTAPVGEKVPEEGIPGTERGPSEDVEKMPEPEADPTAEVVYKWMRCPHCNDRIPLTSLERPLVITCKSCGAKGKLMR